MHAFLAMVALAGLLRAAPALAQEPLPQPTGDVSLRDALALTLERSPELQTFAWEIRARDARAVQAGLMPNPELRTDVENVGGSGNRESFESTETTVRLAQLVELGGKRSKRRRLAELESELATWDYQTKRLLVLQETSKAFVKALAAQERMRLATDQERLAERAIAAVGASVDAGATSPVESTRAQVSLGRVQLARRRAEQELVVARATLAASWGDGTPTFDALVGDLARVTPPPPADVLTARLAAAPDLARWTTELAQRRASLDVEEAQRVPNVTIGAGGRHFSDNGDNAVVLEFSVPLPIFNRNQGGIAEAEHRLAKARAEQAAAQVSAEAALATAAARLSAAYAEATRLRTTVLPQAASAHAGALDAYRQGLFRLVEVLDAQRTLFELRDDYLGVLENYHLLAADVERLTATPLSADADGATR